MFSLLSVTLFALMLPRPQHSLDSFRQELAGARDKASIDAHISRRPPVALFFGERAQQEFRSVFLHIFHIVSNLKKVRERAY